MDYSEEQIKEILESITASLKKLDEAYLELDAIQFDLGVLKDLLKEKFNI